MRTLIGYHYLSTLSSPFFTFFKVFFGSRIMVNQLLKASTIYYKIGARKCLYIATPPGLPTRPGGHFWLGSTNVVYLTSYRMFALLRSGAWSLFSLRSYRKLCRASFALFLTSCETVWNLLLPGIDWSCFSLSRDRFSVPFQKGFSGLDCLAHWIHLFLSVCIIQWCPHIVNTFY